MQFSTAITEGLTFSNKAQVDFKKRNVETSIQTMSKIESTLWQNIISMKKLLQSNIETLSKISVVGLVLINICVDMGHIGHFISALFHAWSTWNTSHKSKQLNSTAQKMIRRKLIWNNVALNPNLEIDWTWDLHILRVQLVVEIWRSFHGL